MAKYDHQGRVTNFGCPACGKDSYTPDDIEPGDSLVCPHCDEYFGPDVVECWVQTVWPYPSWDPNGETF